MKIDWKKKLTSRKFWTAIIGFVVPLLLAFGVGEDVVVQVSGIVMAGATAIAYIIGEGLVDSERTALEKSEEKEVYSAEVSE